MAKNISDLSTFIKLMKRQVVTHAKYYLLS